MLYQKKNRILSLLGLAAGVCFVNTVYAFETDVPATSNIFYSGTNYSPTGIANCGFMAGTQLGDGTLPSVLTLGSELRSIQVLGRNTSNVRYGGGGFPVVSTPDGHPSFNTSILSPIGTVQGFRMDGRHGMLGAVFLDDTVLTTTGYGGGNSGQTVYTPADMNAPTLSYPINQTFAIGDGTVVDFGVTASPSPASGTEQRQTIEIPVGATKFSFGFFDAGGIIGGNRCYLDNQGNIFVRLAMSISDDSGIVEGGVGGTAIPSVLNNDTLDSNIPSAPDATWTSVGSWTAGIQLDPSTGAVDVDASVPNGTYAHDYELCDTTTVPESCMIATATIIVRNGIVPITANNDSGSVVSDTGGVAINNIRLNDRLNGLSANATNTTIAVQGVWPAAITLDVTSGAVSVAPATAIGSYVLSYQLCESNDPSNCDNAIIRINVRANATQAIPAQSLLGLILTMGLLSLLAGVYIRKRRIYLS